MACVSPRAGADSARRFPITQGVQLSHNTMKQIQVRSPLQHKVYRCWTPISNIKNMASQAVVTEEMEAREAIEASEKKTRRWQRWQAHETMELIAAKKQQDVRDVKGIEAPGIELKKTKNKWKEIEALCWEKGIERSAQQCQARWSRLMSAFTHIRSWEETRNPEQPSFWSLKLDERKAMGFLLSLDQKIYNALDELHNSKVDAIPSTKVNDNVEEVAELESVNHMPRGYERKNYTANETDVNCSSVQELEECARGNQVCKAMESTKTTNEFPEMVVDDKKAAQLLHANAGINPTNLHIETIDGSKKDSCIGPLVVDERNRAQMLHASAENVDCHPTSLHTALQAEPLKSVGISENISFQIGCDQKYANDNVPVLPAIAKIDGSNKDSCKGCLEEHGAEGNTIIKHRDDVNVTFSHVMYDKNIQAGKDEGAVKSADSSISKTNVSVIDSQVAEEVANSDSALLEESWQCQKSKSHLSSSGVDALNVNESMPFTGTESSCVSIDKEACKNYSVDRNLAEAACSDKTQKVESVFGLCEDNSSRLTNAEDFLTASADNVQSPFIGAQIKADAWQMGEGTVAVPNNLDPMEEAFGKSQMVLHTRFEQPKRDSDPFLASKEEISLGVLKQGSENNSRSKLFESISTDQGKDFEKMEKIELHHSEEGNIEMIADMAERNAHRLEHSAVHSFDRKEVQDLKNGHDTEAEHFEVKGKDMDTFVERETFGHLQSIYDRNEHDSIGRTKLAINDGDATTGTIGIRTSPVDTNTPAPTRTKPQFQQAGSASEQKSTIKGDCGSFESVGELQKLAVEEPKDLEFTIKVDRANPVTSGKESMENRSPMTTTSSTGDEDVFMYIPAAIGNFLKSSLQTIGKIFRF